MTVGQLSRGNQITKEIDAFHEKIKERLTVVDAIERRQESRDEELFVSAAGAGAYIQIDIFKRFIESDIALIKQSIKDLEAEFLSL